jgi:hypothetical protein
LKTSQQRWLADLLLEGAPLDKVEQTLVEQGLTSDQALGAIETILSSPIFAAARPKVQLGQRLACAADLHQRVCHQGGEVPTRQALSAERFYREWLGHHQPVVLKGFGADWPALDWSIDGLAAQLGDEPIEVLVGRDQADHPDRDFKSLTRSIKPSQWAQMLNKPGNDTYLVARNHLMQGAKGPELIVDTPIDEHWVRTDDLLECCSLWVGPKGTYTALHHDTCHALFVQLVGRKRFELASPLVVDVLVETDPFYHRQRDLRNACDEEQIVVANLEPGDALFLPVGWWHQATALEASIGMSFNGLHAPNDYPDYCPGRL